MPTCDNCDHETDQHDSDGCKMGRRSVKPCPCMLDFRGAWVGQRVACKTPVFQVGTISYGCLLREGHAEVGLPWHRHRGQVWESASTPVANPDRTKVADEQVGGGHYRQTKLQPWDVIDAWGLDFYAGNALKYLYRAGRKGPKVEDLKKARHYIDKMIELTEEEG